MFAGGIADKLGNRYEAKWLVRQLLDVIGGKAEWLRYESIETDFGGFEFAVGRPSSDPSCIYWHQTKINAPNGNWTISALKREKVLLAFRKRLSASEQNRCVFVSQDPAKDLRPLAEKATTATSMEEFRKSLGQGHADRFEDLVATWEVSPEIAYSWLKRSDFRTIPQSEIESHIETFSDFYFIDGKNAFSILRDFLENRFNKQITTEIIRSEIRSARQLSLKDWSLDPTLHERLSAATATYLDTYHPFGAGGSTISRIEACQLADLIGNPSGPSVILLTGVAGSGKSGVIRELIAQLKELDILHLALRIDQHLDCTSPKTLGKAVTDREESPVSTLKGTAPHQTSVLIVDQVDAVSEVSGRNGVVKQAILRLVDDVRNFGSIRLVIACRTFDLESDQRLKALKDTHGIGHVDVPLLAWGDTVEPLLLSKSVDVKELSGKQRDLLCLPLNLSIFFETFDGTKPSFTSRNDLFSRLLEKKGRSIRTYRQPPWELVAPLSKLAEWMSEQQRLDAPEGILSDFNGALDILCSEGFIVRSRHRVNFFHESFFDYVYARSFASRHQSLESLLLSSEQHLFRRTQARQILETLRQTDTPRYLRELRAVLRSGSIRYHIKVAIAQWLGSLSDPLNEEKNIVIGLDTMTGPFPQLVRYAFLASPSWFDMLFQDGWVSANLVGSNPERMDATLWWLSSIAGQRPREIAGLLDDWWGGSPDRGKKLLDWFGFVKRQKPDAALIELCSKVIRSKPPGLFEDRQPNPRDLLLHTWAGENPTGAGEILKAYFDAWSAAHQNQHPFARDEFRDLDAHSLGEIAKKAPGAFVEGTIEAFSRSIDVIIHKKANGEWDYSFKHRAYSGHHFGADAFLNMFRGALKDIASKEPDTARQLLARIDPVKHEVFTHVWLETITANGSELCNLLPHLLDSPHLFDAGWDGTDWKSFADAARESIPQLAPSDVSLVENKILSHLPELKYARELAYRLRLEGESEPWRNKKTVTWYLNRSGHEQWCILENIGDIHLTNSAQSRLAELRRKFQNSEIPEPHHNEAHWVQSPIKRDKAARLTDAQWLRAMERFDNDEDRRRGRTFTEGGARQLAGELQHLAKEQPVRFAELLDRIPNNAHQAYISHILWGLAEADDLEDDVIGRAIRNAHARPDRPYGFDIARLFEKHPRLAADPAIFDVLIWYVEHGEANDADAVDSSNTERELVSIDDLMESAGRLHIRGINGVRGWAAEALGSVLWHAPEMIDEAWTILERRAAKETLVSVRCCLIRAIVPLYNHDRQRCAALAEHLSRPPADHTRGYGPTVPERIWLRVTFPPERLPRIVRRVGIRCGRLVERLVRRYGVRLGARGESKWLSPLLTHQGVYLLSFLVRFVPAIGRRLIYRLVVCGDEISRMVGAWHVFRLSFQDSEYAPLADVLVQDGVVYRRLAASIASDALAHEEYRFRAETLLHKSFDDEDKQVRHQAANVFQKIKSEELLRYKELAYQYINSKAFLGDSWAFFHALAEAECKVDDLVIAATETLLSDIELSGNAGGRRTMDLHQLQDIIKREYVSSEADPDLRRRLLDLIDRMLSLELYGVDEVIKAHER